MLQNIKKLFLTLLVIPCFALADKTPSQIMLTKNCSVYRMCEAETTIGACITSDTLVAVVPWAETLTFYSTQGVGAYSCNVFSSDFGYQASARQQLNVTALTPAAQVLTLSGFFYYVWVECTAVGTQATVNMVACGSPA